MKNTNAMYYSQLDSPVGCLTLLGNERALTGLYMHEHRHQLAMPPDCTRRDDVFRRAREQLAAYFAGELRQFAVPLESEGSPFQKAVWQALCDIPFGATESYGGLARRLGNANASRAVGLANGRNPISIIVPCHRVIGANGSLTGYGGGLERKRWLLEHELRIAGRPQAPSLRSIAGHER